MYIIKRSIILNISELLVNGKHLLKDIEDGNIKARILLEYILKLSREKIVSNPNIEVSDNNVESYLNKINDIKNGMPIQYITNKQEFMKLNFYVDKNVLIPQPDTEILVEKAIEICNNHGNDIKILDLCTGSGAIGISIAKNIKNAKVYATDIKNTVIDIAKQNAKQNNVDNIEFIVSDMFENIQEKDFDIIVSNPPYIETDVIKTLPTEVRNEPIIALDGGKDGLKFYKIILSEYKKYLKKDGYLLLEIGYNQAKSVGELINLNYSIIEDLAGNDRVIIIKGW
ncbi:MAG TPA: peptide chain release factor N(5)-glutamine methyltransferase [Clostridiales bacterium]|jgi:release factor glutamine methyltransferase|nr:peptide chain release factor N(5)-glutamine methyltransferase [Clostridiales bacterium]